MRRFTWNQVSPAKTFSHGYDNKCIKIQYFRRVMEKIITSVKLNCFHLSILLGCIWFCETHVKWCSPRLCVQVFHTLYSFRILNHVSIGRPIFAKHSWTCRETWSYEKKYLLVEEKVYLNCKRHFPIFFAALYGYMENRYTIYCRLYTESTCKWGWIL